MRLAGGGGRGIVAWSRDKTWTQVYAEIVAADYNALIVVADSTSATAMPGYTFTITAGTYNLNKCAFFSAQLCRVTFAPGALLAQTGTDVTLQGYAVNFYSTAAITASGSSPYVVLRDGATFFHTSNVEAAFPQIQGWCELDISSQRGYGGASADGTKPVFDLAAGETINAYIYGNIFSTAKAIGGSAGSLCSLMIDAAAYRDLSDNFLIGSTVFDSYSPSGGIPRLGLTTENYANAVGSIGYVPSTGLVNVSHSIGWRDLTEEIATGNAAIDQGSLIKASATAGRYETLGAADAAALCIGVARTECTGAASSFVAQFVTGKKVYVLSDGTGTIPAGSPVEPSTTVAGRVKAGSTNLIGYNVDPLVAASLDESFYMRMKL